MEIGIFWIYNENIIGEKCSINEGEDPGIGIVDSPFTHIDLWEDTSSFLKNYPLLVGTEYQSLPRGRVVFSKVNNMFLIYMDSSLFNKKIKMQVLDFFGLDKSSVKWMRDQHYTTDQSDIDNLLEN